MTAEARQEALNAMDHLMSPPIPALSIPLSLLIRLHPRPLIFMAEPQFANGSTRIVTAPFMIR
jgi:hypothetical protein